MSFIFNSMRMHGIVANRTINSTYLKSIFLPAAIRNHYATKPTEHNDQWRPIYYCPLIKLAAAFNKVKLYQGIGTAICIPASFALEQAGELPTNASLAVTAVGVSGLLTLSLCSLLFRYLIGFIYINDEEDKVQFAYIDYWGKRIQLQMDIADIQSYSFMPHLLVDTIKIVPVPHGDDKKKLKLLLRFCSIKDTNSFVDIFGE